MHGEVTSQECGSAGSKGLEWARAGGEDSHGVEGNSSAAGKTRPGDCSENKNCMRLPVVGG